MLKRYFHCFTTLLVLQMVQSMDHYGEEPKPFPFKVFAFAFFGWMFDFYDLVLLGFVKEDVAETLGMTKMTEAWMLGVSLGTSGLGGKWHTETYYRKF